MSQKLKKKKVIPVMFSITKDQQKRLHKLAEKEDRSMRSVLERMLDQYEGKK